MQGRLAVFRTPNAMDMNANERMHGGTPFVPAGTYSIYITLDPALKRWAISKLLLRDLRVLRGET